MSKCRCKILKTTLWCVLKSICSRYTEELMNNVQCFCTCKNKLYNVAYTIYQWKPLLTKLESHWHLPHGHKTMVHYFTAYFKMEIFNLLVRVKNFTESIPGIIFTTVACKYFENKEDKTTVWKQICTCRALTVNPTLQTPALDADTWPCYLPGCIVRFQKRSILTPRRVIGNFEGEGDLKSQNLEKIIWAKLQIPGRWRWFKPKNLPYGYISCQIHAKVFNILRQVAKVLPPAHAKHCLDRPNTMIVCQTQESYVHIMLCTVYILYMYLLYGIAF